MEGNFYTDIDWSVFTRDEEYKIKEVVKNGHPEHASAVIQVNRPEQEYQLQKLISMFTVHTVPQFESKVRAEMREIEQHGENPIQSPEDEKMWQERLDNEEKEAKEKWELQQKETLRTLKKEKDSQEEVEISTEPVPVQPEKKRRGRKNKSTNE